MKAVRFVHALVAWPLVLGIVSCTVPIPEDCGPAQKIELSKSGDCPQRKGSSECVYIDGYFGIAADIADIHGYGYHPDAPPRAGFTFSAEPRARTELGAYVTIEDSQVANRTRNLRLEGNPLADDKWLIYDDQQREISFDDRVRITGFMFLSMSTSNYPCAVMVSKIEKL